MSLIEELRAANLAHDALVASAFEAQKLHWITFIEARMRTLIKKNPGLTHTDICISIIGSNELERQQNVSFLQYTKFQPLIAQIREYFEEQGFGVRSLGSNATQHTLSFNWEVQK